MGIRVGVKRAVAARGYGSEAVLRDVGLGRWGRRGSWSRGGGGWGRAVGAAVRVEVGRGRVRGAVVGDVVKGVGHPETGAVFRRGWARTRRRGGGGGPSRS